MRIRAIRTLHGPNLLHDRALLVLTLELGALSETDSNALGPFVDRLVALLPSLHEHRCSVGRAGGFVERLRRGTFMGHIVEHVALALTDLVGPEVSVGFGKTVATSEPGVYDVAVRFR